MIHGQRARGEQCVEQLPSAVPGTRRVAPGRAVVEVEVDLLDGEPGPQRVDGHAHLTPESRRKREAGRPRLLAQPALAGERLARP